MKGPRLLGTACVGLLAAAAALWGAAQFVWFRVTADVPGGRVVEFTGGQLRPSLGGVALLALAGVAGVLAASGVLRRIVGYLDFAGNADTAIAIRTALVRDGVAYVQAGGGIVADSDPVAEDAECVNKAMAVLSAVATAATLAEPRMGPAATLAEPRMGPAATLAEPPS